MDDKNFSFVCCWTCQHCVLDVGVNKYICANTGQHLADKKHRYQVCKPTDCNMWNNKIKTISSIKRTKRTQSFGLNPNMWGNIFSHLTKSGFSTFLPTILGNYQSRKRRFLTRKTRNGQNFSKIENEQRGVNPMHAPLFLLNCSIFALYLFIFRRIDVTHQLDE